MWLNDIHDDNEELECGENSEKNQENNDSLTPQEETSEVLDESDWVTYYLESNDDLANRAFNNDPYSHSYWEIDWMVEWLDWASSSSDMVAPVQGYLPVDIN